MILSATSHAFELEPDMVVIQNLQYWNGWEWCIEINKNLKTNELTFAITDMDNYEELIPDLSTASEEELFQYSLIYNLDVPYSMIIPLIKSLKMNLGVFPYDGSKHRIEVI